MIRAAFLVLASFISLAATAASPADAAWPASSPADREYFCGGLPTKDRGTAPAGYAERLRAEIKRQEGQGIKGSEPALKQIAVVAQCQREHTDFYAVNWPAVEGPDNVYLCSDHRGAQPEGYGPRVHRAIFSRIALGMGLNASSRDIRAQGGCPDETLAKNAP